VITPATHTITNAIGQRFIVRFLDGLEVLSGLSVPRACN
jgi:hypothetical protein